MRKRLFFFAGALASLVMLGGAQAKMVRYEINGQRYSYNTNICEQVEEARRRIAAANAAYGAWLKAAAERASNPLAPVLGSPTQREAAEAQTYLKHVLSSSPRGRLRAREGFIPPALLTPATKVPTGPEWIHGLKHDGIRLIAR